MENKEMIMETEVNAEDVVEKIIETESGIIKKVIIVGSGTILTIVVVKNRHKIVNGFKKIFKKDEKLEESDDIETANDSVKSEE